MPEPISRAFTVSDDPMRAGSGGYVGGRDGNFSEVMDPNNPDSGQRNVRPTVPRAASQRGPAPAVVASARFEEGSGYVVDGEDEGVLAENGMTPRQREALMAAARPISDQDAERISRDERQKKKDMAFERYVQSMGPAELDSFMRFGDLAL